WHGNYLIEPITIAATHGWSMLVSANMLLATALWIAGVGLFLAAGPPRELRINVLSIGIVGGALLANLLLFQQWEKSLDPRYLALPLAANAFLASAGLGFA